MAALEAGLDYYELQNLPGYVIDLYIEAYDNKQKREWDRFRRLYQLIFATAPHLKRGAKIPTLDEIYNLTGEALPTKPQSNKAILKKIAEVLPKKIKILD